MEAPPADAAAIQRRLFRLAAAARGPAAAAVAAAVGAAGAAVAQMLAAAQAIAAACGPGGVDAARAWLPWILAALSARAAFAAIGERAAQRIATQAKSRLRLALARCVVLERRAAADRTGEIVTTAIDGVERLDAFFRRFAPQALATLVVPLVVLIAVAALDPWSAVLLGLTAPLIPLFMWLLGTMAAERSRQQWHALGALGGRFLDTLQGLPTLTLFNRAAAAAAALDRASAELRARTMGVLRIAFLSGALLELAASMSIALLAASVGVRLTEGWMALAPALAVLLLAPEFYLPFRQLGQRHHAGMEGVAAAERIFALLDAAPRHAHAEHAEAADAATTCIVTMDDVSFTYPDGDAPALRQVSLQLRPGTLTALAGPSGAGKSTLLRVLLRLIEPDGGGLVLNGRAATDIGLAVWRRHFAFVPQRPHFFDGSILDNLRIGRPAAVLDEVVEAARQAQADDFIAALPLGYATHIDDAASRLSEGERQRLAIARALVRRAPILVLDEPTSSLDAATEAAIAETIVQLARERSVVVAAHRLSTIRRADTVLVLDAGRIVERGAPRELSRDGGAYARLLRAAAQEVA